MKCETCYSREDCTENEKDYCISRDYVEYEYYDEDDEIDDYYDNDEEDYYD